MPKGRSTTGEQRDNCSTSLPKNSFTCWLGTNKGDQFCLNTETGVYTRKYQPAYLLSPPPPPYQSFPNFQMPPIQQPQGLVVHPKAVRVPKKDKWAHILP